MPELLDHQKRGVEFVRAHERAAIFDEAGTGKTAVMLKSAEEPLLIVAPRMILDTGVWDDEIEKWCPGIENTQVAYSSLMERGPRGKIFRDGNGVATNPPRERYVRRWGSIRADESHYITSRKSSYTNAFLKLVNAKHSWCDDVVIATGTPIPNWAQEAFSALQVMYPDEAKPGRRFGSYWNWANEWFQVTTSFYNTKARDVGDLHPHLTWDDFNERNWGDRYIRRLREECLDLPPLAIQPWFVEMAAEQKKVYKSLKTDFVAWLSSGVEVASWSDAAQTVHLRKAATGVDVMDSTVRSSGKLDALRVILADRPLPTLVVGHFRATIRECARVASELNKRVVVVHGGYPMKQRVAAVRAFQRGEADVLCATIDTIREGMTLHQGGADQVVRVERSFLPSRNDQVIRRLHRIGLERPVTCIDLISKDTYDISMEKLLVEKSDNQMKALRPRDLIELVA